MEWNSRDFFVDPQGPEGPPGRPGLLIGAPVSGNF